MFLPLKIVLEPGPGTEGQDVRAVPLGGSGRWVTGAGSQLWSLGLWGLCCIYPSAWQLAGCGGGRSWRLAISEGGRRPMCPRGLWLWRQMVMRCEGC